MWHSPLGEGVVVVLVQVAVVLVVIVLVVAVLGVVVVRWRHAVWQSLLYREEAYSFSI